MNAQTLANRAAHAQAYAQDLTTAGIVPIWWDNGGGAASPSHSSTATAAPSPSRPEDRARAFQFAAQSAENSGMNQGWQDKPDEESGLDERRKKPRYGLTGEVTFESRHNFYSAVAQDLSAGGLFIATDSLLPEGEFIRVRFSLPDAPERLDAIAEVRWSRDEETGEGEPGIGLEFLQLSPKSKQAIRAFVEKREALRFAR